MALATRKTGCLGPKDFAAGGVIGEHPGSPRMRSESLMGASSIDTLVNLGVGVESYYYQKQTVSLATPRFV